MTNAKKDTLENMPETPAPKKPYIRFAVPDELLRDAQELVEAEGFNRTNCLL